MMINESSVAIVVSLVALFAVALAELIKGFVARRQTRAAIVLTAAQASDVALQSMHTSMTELRMELTETRTEMQTLKDENGQLKDVLSQVLSALKELAPDHELGLIHGP